MADLKGEIGKERQSRLETIILVDNRFNLTEQLKKTTADMVASALPYHNLRGDKIVIRQVPFHYATAVKTEGLAHDVGSSESIGTKESVSYIKNTLGASLFIIKKMNPMVSWGIFGLIILWILARLFRGRKGSKSPIPAAAKGVPLRSGAAVPSAVDQVRNAVSKSPEKVAKLIEKWLTEEEENKE